MLYMLELFVLYKTRSACLYIHCLAPSPLFSCMTANGEFAHISTLSRNENITEAVDKEAEKEGMVTAGLMIFHKMKTNGCHNK